MESVERPMLDRRGSLTPPLELQAPLPASYRSVLTPDALAFVAELVRTFQPDVDLLLARRRETQARYEAGERPRFLPETEAIRNGDWTVAPLPADLQDRRVEITG